MYLILTLGEIFSRQPNLTKKSISYYQKLFLFLGHIGYHESEERESLIDDMLNGAKMGQYNNLLESLAKHMTSKVFNRIKTFVRGKLGLNYFHFHISTMC